VGAGAFGGKALIKKEEEEETLGQLRDRLGLMPGLARVTAPGPRAAFVHIKIEDCTSEEDTEVDEEGEEEEEEADEEEEARGGGLGGEYGKGGGGGGAAARAARAGAGRQLRGTH
jgi:hypothetical protein